MTINDFPQGTLSRAQCQMHAQLIADRAGPDPEEWILTMIDRIEGINDTDRARIRVLVRDLL